MNDSQQRGSSAGAVTVLAIVNVVVFALWLLPAAPMEVMAGHFLVSWDHLAAGRVWVLLTAVFSHNLMLHLLVNMVVLLSFGPPLERLLGTRRFLSLYLTAGVAGSLAHAVLSRILLDAPGQPALGASSALAGILPVFAFVFPRAKVLLFFVIPMPAIVAVVAFIGIDVWGLLMQVEGAGLPIGHGAHLGGAAAGIVYWLVRRDRLQDGAPRRGSHPVEPQV